MTRARLSIALGIMPLPILGCGLTPVDVGDADRPLDPAAVWVDLESPLDPAVGAELESEGGLTVDAAVALALRLEPELRALRARRGIADAQLLAAGLLPDPELDLRALASGAAEVSLLLDVLQGAALRGRRLDAARAASSEFDLEVAEAEWAVACDVRERFVETRRDSERVALLERARDLANAEAAAARKAHEVGAGSILVALDAEAAALEIGLSIVEASAERDAARGDLLRLLGLSPEVELRLAEHPALDDAPDREVALTRMRAARLDLTRAESAHRAARAELAIARGEAWPLPSLGPTIESDAEAGFDPGIELSWTLPLFSGNRGAIAEAAARVKVAAEDYVARLALARAEVDLALSRVEAADARARMLRDELLPRSMRLVELVSAAAERGEVSRLEVLRRRRESLTTERAALDAEYESLASRIALRRAMGPE